MWYKPKNESSIFTPAVLVYPDRIQENIRRLISIAGSSQRLRPHVKTHKMGEVIKLQVEQGIQKFNWAVSGYDGTISEGKDGCHRRFHNGL